VTKKGGKKGNAPGKKLQVDRGNPLQKTKRGKEEGGKGRKIKGVENGEGPPINRLRRLKSSSHKEGVEGGAISERVKSIRRPPAAKKVVGVIICVRH